MDNVIVKIIYRPIRNVSIQTRAQQGHVSATTMTSVSGEYGPASLLQHLYSHWLILDNRARTYWSHPARGVIHPTLCYTNTHRIDGRRAQLDTIEISIPLSHLAH